MACGVGARSRHSHLVVKLDAGKPWALAPLADDSGDKTGARHIRGGRAFARLALYMPAITAIRYNASFKAFYDRLLAAGKKPKQALTAVMRKLLVLANTLIRENRIWLPTYP